MHGFIIIDAAEQFLRNLWVVLDKGSEDIGQNVWRSIMNSQHDHIIFKLEIVGFTHSLFSLRASR